MKSSESRHTKSLRHLLEIEKEADKQVQESLEKNKQIITDAKKEANSIIDKAKEKAKKEGEKITAAAEKKAKKESEQQIDSINKEIEDLKQQSAQHMDEAVDSLVAWVTAKGN